MFPKSCRIMQEGIDVYEQTCRLECDVNGMMFS